MNENGSKSISTVEENRLVIPREVMAEVLRDQEIEAAGESLVRRDTERAGRCVCLTGLRRSGKTVT